MIVAYLRNPWQEIAAPANGSNHTHDKESSKKGEYKFVQFSL